VFDLNTYDGGNGRVLWLVGDMSRETPQDVCDNGFIKA